MRPIKPAGSTGRSSPSESAAAISRSNSSRSIRPVSNRTTTDSGSVSS
jgi:hypothetical protein